MKKIIIATAFISLTTSASVMAGEMSDFENAMRAAYSDYRAALLTTNTGKRDEAAKTVDKFATEWTELSKRPVPPQYADDDEYDNTMRKVSDLTAKSKNAIIAGKLPEAHVILEGIRGQIGKLHARAGLFGISDRMNAYHARMEKVIGNPGMDANTAREEAAVLGYLIDDVAAHPPAGADPSFAKLAADVKASVDALMAAADDGSSEAIKAAIGKLKKPYTVLFLKFG